jgi:hypothetical protein
MLLPRAIVKREQRRRTSIRARSLEITSAAAVLPGKEAKLTLLGFTTTTDQ